jgi:hypothetical protein
MRRSREHLAAEVERMISQQVRLGGMVCVMEPDDHLPPRPARERLVGSTGTG